MTSLVSTILVALATLIVLSSALTTSAQRSDRGKRQSCSDGRLCQCQGVLSEGGYINARRIVECLDSSKVNHVFSAGSSQSITEQTCKTYNVDAINNSQLRQCVFKKIGFVETIKGVDRWDVDLIRNININYYAEQFPGENNKEIRKIFIITFFVCQADPFDFTEIPFEACKNDAIKFLRNILALDDSKAVSLSNDAMVEMENIHIATNLLETTEEDIERVKSLNPLSSF